MRPPTVGFGLLARGVACILRREVLTGANQRRIAARRFETAAVFADVRRTLRPKLCRGTAKRQHNSDEKCPGGTSYEMFGIHKGGF